MPRGYTADVKYGISFSVFAMNCARAFGACATLRDEEGGGQHIPEKFEPSDYHSKELLKSLEKLNSLRAMLPHDCEEAAESEYIKSEEGRVKRLAENSAQIESYRNMLESVRFWSVPTDNHVKLKEFMIEQLESSIKFDDMSDYYNKPTEKLTGQKWLEREIESTIKSINYHEDGNKKEIERAEERTAWVSALRESLK